MHILKQSELDKDVVRQQVGALADLQYNWNSYGALPPTLDAIRHAIRWLNQFFSLCQETHILWCKPNVSASAEGEVVFEWWDKCRTLSVYIDADEATFHKSQYSDGQTVHAHGNAWTDLVLTLSL